jgi:glycosyltransferase involved in cell wall biosynthesis
MIIDVIIPCYNEEKSIGSVLKDIPKDCVRNIIVCNNASKDNTKQVALENGAIVIDQPLKGYGNACLKGMEYIAKLEQKPEIVVFLDGDYSDHPEEMPKIVQPIIENITDIVIGSRVLGNLEPGSMMPQQVFGNKLATFLIRLIYGYHFSDLGPFRAIRYSTLLALKMEDKNFGWTVELQIKAAKNKLRIMDIPVSYRKRIGISKVSGTVKGSIMAGYKIIYTIFKYI